MPEVLPLRGLMLDAARTPERMSFYRRFIDFCVDWDVNALHLRLTDDEGSAFRFESHPEIITYPDALSHQDAGELVAYAAERGIQIIPEIESLSHSRCIYSVPEHAELDDTNRDGKGWGGLCPVHPGTLELMEDLYKETASVFPSVYIHGGCGEIDWGGSALSREALKHRSSLEIFTDYLNSLSGIARGLGKKLIVWRAHMVEPDPATIARLDDSIIIHDWCYTERDPDVLRAHMRTVLDAGNSVIGGPAVVYCEWGPRIGTDQIRTLDAFAEAYRTCDEPGNLGILASHWVPTAYLSDSVWDSLAYAAVAISEGWEVAQREAFPRFVKRHFGSQWDEGWAEAFDGLYQTAPRSYGLPPRLPVPWATEEALRAAAARPATIGPAYGTLRGQLLECGRRVRRNLADFRALELSVEYLEHLFWRDRLVAEAAGGQTGPCSAEDLIRTIAGRDADLLERLDANWDRHRPADSLLKRKRLMNIAYLELLPAFAEAAAFSAELAAAPARFRAAVGLKT